MPKLSGFPDFSHHKTKDKIADLVRLAEEDLTANKYVNGPGMSKLLAPMLNAYKNSVNTTEWENDPCIKRAKSTGKLFNLFLSSAFDLLCNIEYVHGRVVNSNWIYCNRDDRDTSLFFSFLKQCPRCCLDHGLEDRLSKAQHKPSSHHIGEITTISTGLVLKTLTTGSSKPLKIATITKQSHDVDAIGYSDDLIVLFEIKSSPLVSYPLRMRLDAPLTEDKDGEPVEYRQHSLVDATLLSDVSLFIPHRNWDIPLGRPTGTPWPYSQITKAIQDLSTVRIWFSAWLELFFAYSVPKTKRNPQQQALTYLVNGWGDEIDSNKTKPGLGRTDDIKKGTYQLIKFGAYYNDEDARPQVRGVLAANMDPLFLKEAYFDKLSDIRWGKGGSFEEVGDSYHIDKDRLYYLYGGVIAFNNPVINDELLKSRFDFEEAELSLFSGGLSKLLAEWAVGRVEPELI